MNRKVLYVKAAIFILDMVCICLGVRSILKTEQFKQDQVVSELEKENKRLEKEQDRILWELQKTGLFVQRYDEIQLAIEECQKEYQELESMYNTKLFIDERSARIYGDREENPYIERYFHIEKDEIRNLTDIEGYEVLPDTEQEGEFLPAGEKIWLRYTGDTFPSGLLIRNPEINIGYHGARVGMQLYIMKGKVPGAEEGKTDVNSEKLKYLKPDDPWRNFDVPCDVTVRYLKYEDKHYDYYFLDIDGMQTFLYIAKK